LHRSDAVAAWLIAAAMNFSGFVTAPVDLPVAGNII